MSRLIYYISRDRVKEHFETINVLSVHVFKKCVTGVRRQTWLILPLRRWLSSGGGSQCSTRGPAGKYPVKPPNKEDDSQTIDTYHCRIYFDNCWLIDIFASDASENRTCVGLVREKLATDWAIRAQIASLPLPIKYWHHNWRIIVLVIVQLSQ